MRCSTPGDRPADVMQAHRRNDGSDEPRPRTLRMIGVVAVLSLLTGCLNLAGSSLYQPEPIGRVPTAWGGRAPQAVVARTGDGLALKGWFWPPRAPDGDILLFLPGRAGNRDTAARKAAPLALAGKGVLVASYRGFGDNPGTPDEQGLYRDGAAFADLARTMRPASRLYLFGDGLGSAVALRLASRPDVTGTATLGAFDRFKNFAPAAMRPMYTDAFDNMAAIREVTGPVILLHGRRDEVVPFSAAENLEKAAGGFAIVAPVDGAAYHSIDLRYVAAQVWQAFDQIAANGVPAKR